MKKLLPWVSLILLLAFTALIFSFSLDSAVESDAKSEDVTRFLQTVCDFLRLDIEMVNGVIRKAAHFVEFAILGALAYICSRAFGYGASPAMLYSIIVATIDETIQIYSPERFSSTEDVLLDFAGALFGILIIFLLNLIIKKKNEKRAVR